MSTSSSQPYDLQEDLAQANRKLHDPSSSLFKFYTFVYSFSSYCWALSTFAILVFLPWLPIVVRIGLGGFVTWLCFQTTKTLLSRLRATREAQKVRRGGPRGEEESLVGDGVELDPERGSR